MKLREARPEELTVLREQRVKAYSPYADLIPSGHWGALRQSLQSEADQFPGAECIVAEFEGELAGSVVLFPPKADAYDGLVDAVEYPEVRMLAVDEAFRGQGVALALIEECIARSRAKGYRQIGLHTGEFMKPAIQLYEKLGFRRVPEHDFQPADDGINVRAYRLEMN